MKEKYFIKSSNLTLRFYARDGWTKEILNKFLIKGKIEDSNDFFDDGDLNYFTFSMGSEIDVNKLLKFSHKVVRNYDDNPNESDESFIKRML